MADPTSLFSSIDYQSTGALLWPDYWQSSAAADLAAVLDVAELPNETFESGQMVFEKQRCASLTCKILVPLETIACLHLNTSILELVCGCPSAAEIAWGYGVILTARIFHLPMRCTRTPGIWMFSGQDLEGADVNSILQHEVRPLL